MPRPSVSGLQAALSSCRISTTTTTTTTAAATATARKAPITSSAALAASSPWRAFSTTQPAASAFVVPPESPKFISVPEPPQSAEPKLPPIKGFLPVPRDMFPRREGNRKVTPEYIAAATPVSKAEQAGEPPRTEHEARRRRMAAARRAAFASGIQGLYMRKKQREQRAAARREANRQANLAAATAPEPLDEVLTRPSVRLSTAADVRVELDPNRFEAAERARARHEAKMARKSEARRDALSHLYVAAQNFIVDEAELEKRVEEIFTPDHHRYGAIDRGQSIWDVHRAPINIAELRAEVMGWSSNALAANKSAGTKTTERQKTVAEELTGGKM